MTGYHIPTLAARKSLQRTRQARAERRDALAAIAKADNDSQLDHAIGKVENTSVVGYMRTIQADRADYALMLRYVKAKQREDAKAS